MKRVGQLCTVEWLGSLTRLFYYSGRPHLYLEILRRDHGTYAKHLLLLVGPAGKPLTLPEGSRLIHVESGEEQELLERVVSQAQATAAHA